MDAADVAVTRWFFQGTSCNNNVLSTYTLLWVYDTVIPTIYGILPRYRLPLGRWKYVCNYPRLGCAYRMCSNKPKRLDWAFSK